MNLILSSLLISLVVVGCGSADRKEDYQSNPSNIRSCAHVVAGQGVYFSWDQKNPDKNSCGTYVKNVATKLAENGPNYCQFDKPNGGYIIAMRGQSAGSAAFYDNEANTVTTNTSCENRKID